MTKEYRRVVCPHCMNKFHIELDVHTDIMIIGIEMIKEKEENIEYDT